jgi:hypothetical protein
MDFRRMGSFSRASNAWTSRRSTNAISRNTQLQKDFSRIPSHTSSLGFTSGLYGGCSTMRMAHGTFSFSFPARCDGAPSMTKRMKW